MIFIVMFIVGFVNRRIIGQLKYIYNYKMNPKTTLSFEFSGV